VAFPSYTLAGPSSPVSFRGVVVVSWGTLVPADLALVQIGGQAMADRYNVYAADRDLHRHLVGCAEILKGWTLRPVATGFLAGTVVLGLSIASWVQAGYWTTAVPCNAACAEGYDNTGWHG